MNFDPVKAERYQDGMVKAREKMQRELEEKAAEHEALMEEVNFALNKVIVMYVHRTIAVTFCRRNIIPKAFAVKLKILANGVDW